MKFVILNACWNNKYYRNEASDKDHSSKILFEDDPPRCFVSNSNEYPGLGNNIVYSKIEDYIE